MDSATVSVVIATLASLSAMAATISAVLKWRRTEHRPSIGLEVAGRHIELTGADPDVIREIERRLGVSATGGGAMSHRGSAATLRSAQEEYIRAVAASGESPAVQIAQAKALLDDGIITQEEFAQLKARALG